MLIEAEAQKFSQGGRAPGLKLIFVGTDVLFPPTNWDETEI